MDDELLLNKSLCGKNVLLNVIYGTLTRLCFIELLVSNAWSGLLTLQSVLYLIIIFFKCITSLIIMSFVNLFYWNDLMLVVQRVQLGSVDLSKMVTSFANKERLTAS